MFTPVELNFFWYACLTNTLLSVEIFTPLKFIDMVSVRILIRPFYLDIYFLRWQLSVIQSDSSKMGSHFKLFFLLQICLFYFALCRHFLLSKSLSKTFIYLFRTILFSIIRYDIVSLIGYKNNLVFIPYNSYMLL